MRERKIIETQYGPVDRKALEKLQNSFDTKTVLEAVDAIDDIRGRLVDLRKEILDLHSMSAAVINENHACNHPSREEWIWELAGMVVADLEEFEDELRAARQSLQPLETLLSGDYFEKLKELTGG
jgi:hypothetical protein